MVAVNLRHIRVRRARSDRLADGCALQRQRDHAAEHDQSHRADLFDRLLTRIDNQVTRIDNQAS